MSPRGNVVPAVTLAAFVALGLVGILHHEMWRDELEIWLIARDSGTLGELFNNMRYEGHPVLWYLIAWGLSRLTTNPLALQVTSLLIGAGSATLFLWRAPFGRLQRVLFCFGYLAAYEFTVISRSYGLELLLALAFCALWPERETRLPWLAAILFLLANTHLYGSILAAALGLLLLIETARPAGGARRPSAATSLACGALIAGGIVLGAGGVWLQHRRIGPSHAFAPKLDDARWYAESLESVAVGYLPLPRPGDPHSWNTSALELLPRRTRPWPGAVLGAALLAVSLASLSRRPRVLLVFVVAVAAMLCISVLFWRGQMRQHLQPFVAFLVCAWLSCSEDARPLGPPAGRLVLLSRFLAGLFAVQMAAGLHAFGVDYARPFSNSKAAAAALHEQDLDGAVFVGSIDYAVQTLAAYGIGPIYYPESERFATFVHWGVERRPEVEPTAVLDAAVRLLRERGGPLVLITTFPMFPYANPEEFLAAPGVRVRLLGRFEGAIVPTEDFHLFRFDRTSGPAADREGGAGVDSPGEGAR